VCVGGVAAPGQSGGSDRSIRLVRAAPQELRLPHAPQPAIIVRSEIDRPQPRMDRLAGSVPEWRLWSDEFALAHYWIGNSCFWDTIRSAAPPSSLLNAELLVAQGGSDPRSHGARTNPCLSHRAHHRTYRKISLETQGQAALSDWIGDMVLYRRWILSTPPAGVPDAWQEMGLPIAVCAQTRAILRSGCPMAAEPCQGLQSGQSRSKSCYTWAIRLAG